MVFYPYRIEFIKESINKVIDPNIFINNLEAKDLNHIGTTTEALRLINLYFKGATIENKVYPYDENSQKIIYNGEVIGYLVGNIIHQLL